MMAETTNKEGQSDEIVAATSEDIAQERVSTTMQCEQIEAPAQEEAQMKRNSGLIMKTVNDREFDI